MSNHDLVSACLKSKKTGGCCDDCISKNTGIPPRQVGQICRKLADEGKLTRKKGKCVRGNHSRIVNIPAATRRRTRGTASVPTAPSIEEAWRYIDRLCRALWIASLGDEPPSSLAEMIMALRDDELIPAHHANMMHTIRTLRNQLVHENVDFGEHETTIAQAAWQIIRAWAESNEREAWKLAVTACG